MESTGPPSWLVTAIQVLLGLSVVGFAVWRGELAHRAGEHALVRARARRAYRCFLVGGLLLLGFWAVGLLVRGKPMGEQQAILTAAGFFLGVPATLTVLVGSWFALMAWRVPWIRVILAGTVVTSTVLASGRWPDAWAAPLLILFLCLVGFSCWRGLAN